MKTLTLLRHAKASWPDAGGTDFDRVLDDRGRADAERMGQEMRRLNLKYDAVFVSPARRVAETVALVERGYGERLRTKIMPEIYDASVDRLLDLVRAAGADVGSLLMVGHNPGLHELALLLTQSGDGTMPNGRAASFPTATLAEIRLPIESWAEAGKSGGTLNRFVMPRDL